jgi:hypothetical protein
MRDPVEQYDFGDKVLKIYQDETEEGPRGWDNLGKMVCFHPDYILGDKHELKKDRFDGWNEIEKYLVKEEKAIAILPLYLYDHSGITMNTTGFNCQWDSMRVGFIYTTKERVEKMCGKAKKYYKTKWLEEQLNGEIKTYDQYITGDVYGFVIEKKETCDKCKHTENIQEDSCWGFYGSSIKENGMMDHFSKDMKKAILDGTAKKVV